MKYLVRNKMKYTAQQQQAVTLRAKNILVSAGAGAGKTRILIDRIVQQVLEGTDITKFLVVTFTKAATLEMKDRLVQSLEHYAIDYPEVQESLQKMGMAHIKTLHAFCFDLVRTYACELDIASNFRILDADERTKLFDEAMGQVLEEEYERSLIDKNDFSRFVDAVSSYKNDDAVTEMIRTIYDFVQDIVDVDGWRDHTHELYMGGKSRTELIQLFEQYLSQLITAAKRTVQMMRDRLRPHHATLSTYHKLMSKLEDYDVFFSQWELNGEKVTWDLSQRIPSKISQKMLSDHPLLYDELTEAHDQLKKIKKELVTALKQYVAFDTEPEGYEYFITAYQLQEKVAARFMILKHTTKAYEFGDLEKFAYQLLRTNGMVREQLQQKFEYIYVDEYQDSSQIQEEIISLIKRPQRLFMVGDVKQSIYAFRKADPSIFINHCKTYGSEQLTDAVRVDMNDNFRTRSDILSQINQLFADNFFGALTYTPSDYLTSGSDYPEHAGPYCSSVYSSEEDQTEPMIAATLIEKLVGSPIFDRESQKIRPCQYKDIVILMRSPRYEVKKYEAVFTARGIPLYAAGIKGYYSAAEVSMATSFLAVLDNPLRDIDWITVLHSPFVGIEEECLAEIGQSGLPDMSYYERTKIYATNQQHELLLKFLSDYERMLYRSKHLSLEQVVWNVLAYNEYFYKMAAAENGKARKANMELLVDKATNAQVTSLHQFVELIQQLGPESDSDVMASVFSDTDDVVRLMSIHKSKGLEFPVVIISGLQKRFNKRDSSGDLIMHRSYGALMRRFDVTHRQKADLPLKAALAYALTQEMKQEELRLLYVAMTRAEDRLYLLTPEGSPFSYERKGLANRMSDFVTTLPHVSVETLVFPKTEIALVDQPSLDSDLLRARLHFKPDKRKQVIRLAKPSMLHQQSLDLSSQKEGRLIGDSYHRVLYRLDFEHPPQSVEELQPALNEAANYFGISSSLLHGERLFQWFQSDLWQRIQQSAYYYKEKEFFFFIDQYKYQGVIDLFFEEADGLVLVDYKSDRAEDPIAVRTAKHRGQLNLYRQALENITGKVVKESYLYFISDHQLVKL